LEDKLELAGSQKRDLEVKLAEKNSTMQEFKTRISELETELGSQIKKKDTLQTGCKSAADHIANLIKKSADHGTEKEALLSEISSL
jgi:chromosome segregation ATPase